MWGSLIWGLLSLCVGALLDRCSEDAIFIYTYATTGLLLIFSLAL